MKKRGLPGKTKRRVEKGKHRTGREGHAGAGVHKGKKKAINAKTRYFTGRLKLNTKGG